MVKYLGIKIELAYIDLKNKLALYYTLWLLALLAGMTLVIAGIFAKSGEILKLWSVILVILLFIKVSYDAVLNMNKEYTRFKEEHQVTDDLLRKI